METHIAYLPLDRRLSTVSLLTGLDKPWLDSRLQVIHLDFIKTHCQRLHYTVVVLFADSENMKLSYQKQIARQRQRQDGISAASIKYKYLRRWSPLG